MTLAALTMALARFSHVQSLGPFVTISVLVTTALALDVYTWISNQSKHQSVFTFAVRMGYGLAFLLGMGVILVDWDHPLRAVMRTATQLHFVVTLLGCACALIVQHLGSQGNAAWVQTRVISLGTLLAILPLIALSVIPDLFGIEHFLPYELSLAPFILAPLSWLYARGAIRLRLDWVLRTERALVGYLLFIFCGLLWLATREIWQQLKIPLGVGTGLSLVLCLAVASAVLPAIRRFIRWSLHGRELPTEKLLRLMADRITLAQSFDALTRLLCDELPSAMNVSLAAFYVAGNETGWRLANQSAAGNVPERIWIDTTTRVMLSESADPCPLGWTSSGHLLIPQKADSVRSYGFPLRLDGALAGLYLLGRRSDGTWPVPSDLNTVKMLAHAATLALQNIGLMESLALRAHDLAEANLRLRTERQDERHTIARELHDVIVQQAIGLKYQTSHLQRVAERTPAEARLHIDSLHDGLSVLIHDLRKVLTGLNTHPTSQSGLCASLRTYANSLQPQLADSGVTLRLTLLNDVRDDYIAGQLFRVAQESIRNALAHARAQNVEVITRRDHDLLVMTISDDGCGLHPEHSLQAGHYGMTGMRGRVQLLNGMLTVHSAEQGGTCVEVRLPGLKEEKS